MRGATAANGVRSHAMRARRKTAKRRITTRATSEPMEVTPETMETITGGFATSAVVGKGSYGEVLSATWNGKRVAVKRLRPTDGVNAVTVRKSVQREISASRDVRGHKNVVRVIGVSFPTPKAEHTCIVYAPLAECALSTKLSTVDARCAFGWKRRAHAAIDAVAGIAALHTAQWIHFDIKSANVLVSATRCVVGDLGTAVRGPHTLYAVPTDIAAAYPYYAPEYLATGRVTYATDVYCTGLLLLEILSGRLLYVELDRPAFIAAFMLDATSVSFRDPLVVWDDAAADRLARTAVACLAADPDMRPTMHDVLRSLKGE